MKKNIALYIIIGIIIVTGIIMYATMGFNFESQYSKRNQIRIDINKEVDLQKIKEIAQDAIKDKKITINKVEFFGNSVAISTTEITEEEKNQIVEKVNEEYGTEISKDNVKINSISNTRIKDIIKPFIKPGLITVAIVIIYSIIRYRKLGVLKVFLESLLLPILAELTFYSIISITRLPFGDVTTAIAIAIYAIVVIILTFKYEKGLAEIAVKQENN